MAELLQVKASSLLDELNDACAEADEGRALGLIECLMTNGIKINLM